MDWIEEKCPLSPLELAFRNILKRKISSLIHLVTITARQLGKVTWCVLGDEDSRFYHSRVSPRLKANKIKVVEQYGLHFFTHKEKERIFTDFFQNILGKKVSTQDLIDLEEVYPNKVDLSFLSQPFSEEEILKALSS
jgi:hypothetical protein